MSYKLNSDNLTHPFVKPMLKELDNYFRKSGIQFFIIGAMARDIVMEIYNEKSGRLTYDMDIAVGISNWDKYLEIQKGIVNLKDFSKDTQQGQRFIYQALSN